ncbi:MAG: STAS domain-containing protein [Candidatus Rifleibacteriota bacterium]
MANTSLKIEIIEAGEPGLFVKLSGELDQLTVQQLREKLQDLSAEKTEQLVFDLENLEFMASAGLAVFAAYYEIYQNNNSGQVLKIIKCPENVKRVFEITKTAEIFQVS